MILRTVFPLARWFHTKARRRALLLVAWVITYVIASAPAQAAMAGKTSPDGMGGLFTIPNLRQGQAPLLFEAYSPQRYTLYQDFGWNDIVDKVAYPIYEALMELSYAIVKLAIGLTWWLHDMTTMDTGSDAIAKGIQSTAASMQDWMLPTALAVGALIAYVRARQGTADVLGQVLTVALAAIAVIGLSQSATSVVGALDRGRVVMAETVNSLGANSISQQNEPFKFSKDPHLTANTPNVVRRKSGDVVWREFYVTTWCQANFGSQEACKAYGDGWLAAGNFDARKHYLEDTIQPAEGGDDADTVKYIKGSDPGSRLGISIFGLVIAIGGAAVIGGLAFFALLPWLLALVLLYLVVFFLCLMVIPGRPRQIGADYVQSILGLTLFSALCGGLLSAMLLLMIQASKLTGQKGWLAGMLMMIAALGATWEARKLMNRMLTGSAGSGGGFGAMLGGLAMARMGTRALGNLGRRHSGGGGGGRPTGGPKPPPQSRTEGSPRSVEASRRAGQLAGAGRHPVVAATKGANRAGQFFKARGHATGGAVKGRTQAMRSAAAAGYASTGLRDASQQPTHAEKETSSAHATNTARTAGREQRPSGDRGSTRRNMPPTHVNHTPRQQKHPAGAHAHGWTPRPAPAPAPRQEPSSSTPAGASSHHPAPEPAHAAAPTTEARSDPAPRRQTPAPRQEAARPRQQPRRAARQQPERQASTPRPRPRRPRPPKGDGK